MNRGYAGFYKGIYLRSSYEYAYAKYLDYNSIAWGYEDKNFDLGYKIYKPDFFFYDSIGNIKKIIEVKSRNKEAKDNARKALGIIENLYRIECDLISYEELLLLYKELPFSLTSTITEWIESEHTTINKAAKGDLNAHFDMKHTEVSKLKIGEHTKKLWNSNSIAKQKMLEGLRNSGLAQKGKLKTLRVNRVCKRCQACFEVLVTSKQLYCSQRCSGKVAIIQAGEAYIAQRKSIHCEIKTLVINWSLDNKVLIEATRFNNIKTSISPLVDEIEKKFGVKDFRVISKAVFQEDRGRKELLKFMKEISNQDT